MVRMKRIKTFTVRIPREEWEAVVRAVCRHTRIACWDLSDNAIARHALRMAIKKEERREA